MPKIRFVEECTPLLTVSTCTHSWCASRWRSTGRVGARTAHQHPNTAPSPPITPITPHFPQRSQVVAHPAPGSAG